MAIQEIPLPFERWGYLCDICGYNGMWAEKMEPCRTAPAEDVVVVEIAIGAMLHVGGVVSIYTPVYEPRSHRRVRSAERSQWRITGISYRQPQHPMFKLAMAMASTHLGEKEYKEPLEPPIHEMEITLAQTLDGSPNLEGATGRQSMTLTARRCALWHKGIEEELIEAGLISPPPPPKPARRWWQFWR